VHNCGERKFGERFFYSQRTALEKSIACRPCEQPAMTDDVQDGTVAPFA
jgi:hypothetical protein